LFSATTTSLVVVDGGFCGCAVFSFFVDSFLLSFCYVSVALCFDLCLSGFSSDLLVWFDCEVAGGVGDGGAVGLSRLRWWFCHDGGGKVMWLEVVML
jgi:hypothetical protein